MGTIVYFDVAPPEALSMLILQQLDSFMDWLEKLCLEYPNEFSEDISRFAKQVEHDGVAALHATTSEQAALVDNFVMEFFGNFTESHSITTPANSNRVSIRHYWASKPWLAVHCSPAFEKLWMFMLEGRGIERDSVQLPFTQALDTVCRIGYWTVQECVTMLHELQPLTIPEAEPTFCVLIVRDALQTVVDQQASMLILVN
ncbi:hypothetical protein [Herpetosiphon geysericola]|uniref:Uncharacterized protein n=1 Tax=Herpetosiphon geysericola TaxID=70996 RepID=A0A0P6YMG5_9CHLR|nr:hypothetical protein [Herpetosiphon geysericola]KPL91398.1 hypothetical protein SE18_01715 [Herpetosiphon geysericola]